MKNHSEQHAERIFTDRRKNTNVSRREKLPWPKDKPFKILSLDGGGVRGVYAATILTRVENEITECDHISNYVDLIAGTSTGGIIAIALGLNITASNIEKIYTRDGENIFKQQWWHKCKPLRKLCRLGGVLYDHKELEDVIRRELGNKILGDSTTRLVIPAFMVPKTEIAVFKTDHHPDFKNDWKSPAWEIARATSAAPTYIEGVQYKDTIFLDGGVWANNPIMIAVIDAMSAYDISLEQIKILSIGTGTPPLKINRQNALKGSFQWSEIIKAAMYLTTDNAVAQAMLLLGPDKVIRLDPSEIGANIELDDWKKAIQILPDVAAQDFESNKYELQQFFAKRVQPRHRFHTK